MKSYLAAAATEITDCWTPGAAEVLIMQGIDDVSAPGEWTPAEGRDRRLRDLD
jgi:hypothetical protein